MKVKELVREEALIRIAGQADLLSERARKLADVYRKDMDKGCVIIPGAVSDAERDLQSAIVAVIRVAASYL